MIIITRRPGVDVEVCQFKANQPVVYHGTNNPMVAFRLHMGETAPTESIDDLSDEELLDLTITEDVGLRYSELWLFSLLPTKEQAIVSAEVDAEVYIGASIGDLFTGDDDHER